MNFTFAIASRRRRVLLTLASLIGALGLPAAARGADLPALLTGTWATAGTEFEAERLIGGDVLYLLPGGQAALVGAPLPVRRCADGRVCTPIVGIGGTATYDAVERRLRIAVQEGPRRRELEATLQPGDDTLLLQTSPLQQLQLQRRSGDVPAALAQALTTPPAATPKAPTP